MDADSGHIVWWDQAPILNSDESGNEYQLLAHFSSDQKIGIDIYDGWAIGFWIKRSDLKAGNFENVRIWWNGY